MRRDLDSELGLQQATVRRVGRERPDELQVLLQRRPARVIADVVWCYALIVAAFALLAVVSAAWSAILAFVVIGNRQYAMSIMAHDGKHGNLLEQRRWNDLFTIIVLCIPIGVDFHGEWVNHRAHHRHLGTAEDPDRHLYQAGDKDSRARFLLFLTTVGTLSRSLGRAAGAGAHPAGQRPAALAFLAYRWPTLAAQAVIFAAIAAVFPWWFYVTFWIAPIVCLMFVPHKIRMFCEHAQPLLPDSAADSKRLITYLPGFAERALFSPMNDNYHAEHHLWPAMPYYNLSRLHALLAPQPLIEIRASYVGFLWSYYRQLPLAPAAPASA